MIVRERTLVGPIGAHDEELPLRLRLVVEHWKGVEFVAGQVSGSDAQLYAMALYLYSLQPPPNPNQPDELSAAGERVFERERCGRCHTPPLYTNNKLIPVDGFTVPPEHRAKYDIMNVRIGLDSYSTLKTRRGTGYYKVPSLKDVWMRPVLEHNGSIGSLENGSTSDGSTTISLPPDSEDRTRHVQSKGIPSG